MFFASLSLEESFAVTAIKYVAAFSNGVSAKTGSRTSVLSLERFEDLPISLLAVGAFALVGADAGGAINNLMFGMRIQFVVSLEVRNWGTEPIAILSS